MPSISVLVEGGKASAGPPLGPALGPLGVNVAEVIAKINEKTKHFTGMKVPVKVNVDPATKNVEIEVGSPPVSALVKNALGIDKGASNPKTDKVAELTMEKVVEIAKMKAKNLTEEELKSWVKQVLGTCNSMGVHVEGKRAKFVIADVESGKYDALIAKALQE